MDSLATTLARLSALRACGYHAEGPPATEPTAWAAMALAVHGRDPAARLLGEQLLDWQNADGSLRVEPSQNTPGWATALAILAWQAIRQLPDAHPKLADAIDRALPWLLRLRGTLDEHMQWDGHDTAIQGWPWVAGTHSWLEPTAFSLLALKHTGRAGHRRAREAALLLVNRLLDSGGANYGNTVVFGQELRPHLEPTGVCLLALAGEPDTTGKIGRAIEYLLRELNESTATASLSYGLLGLAAHGALPANFEQWLDAAAQRTHTRDPGAYKLALLALAAQGTNSPLIPTTYSLTSRPATISP